MSQREARVDAYIARAADFARPILKRLRAAAGSCPWHRVWCEPIDGGYMPVIKHDRAGAHTPAVAKACV